MKLLLIQPGAFGDIILCAPIAKWYFDRGYQIDWPIREKFLSTVERFAYVNPIILNEDSLHEDWLRSDVMKCIPMFDDYDKVINLADRGPHPTAQRPGENFEQAKYRIAEVPFEEKHRLIRGPNLKNEFELLLRFKEARNPFALAHLTDSKGFRAEVPSSCELPIIEVTELEGYTIFDWYALATLAEEIYVVESAIHQFLDGIVHRLTPKRYLLPRYTNSNTRYTVSEHWDKRFVGNNING